MSDNKKRKPTALVLIAVLSLLTVGICTGVVIWWPKQDPEITFKADKDRYWQLEDEIQEDMKRKTPGRKERILKRVEEQNRILEKWPDRMYPLVQRHRLPAEMLEE